MKWIEVVLLRAAEKNQKILETRLKQLVRGMSRESGQRRIIVYRRVMVTMDYSIHIIHNGEEAENAGSPLGLQLTAALKEFGLVNHSIWKDATPQFDIQEEVEK